MKSAVALLLVLGACSPQCDPTSSHATGPRSGVRSGPPPEIRDVRPYVPVTPGDRWRVRHEPDARYDHYGVTAIDTRGNAVVFGSDRTTIELIEVTEGGAYIVSPEGVRLVPMIAAPIRVGARTEYTVRQGNAEGRCTLVVNSVGLHIEVAGAPFDACFTQTRACAMPAGGGLPRATTITETETYCPSVGRVARRFVADPPLPFEGVPSDRTTTLVSFHVRGAPVLAPSTSMADRLIVLPSDVSAVCGGGVSATSFRVSATDMAAMPMSGLVVPPDARADDVLLAFEMSDGPFVIESRSSDADLASYVGSATHREGQLIVRDEPPLRFGFSGESVFLRVTPNAGCSAGAPRIEALLRSLLR